MDYSFSRKTYHRLDAAAAEAVQRIFESGLSFRGGQLSPGHNNVRADNAANAFTGPDLDLLAASTDPVKQGYAQMIRLRQQFSALKDVDGSKGQGLLHQMYGTAQTMSADGWQPRSKLVSLVGAYTPAAGPDLNIDRAQLAALGESWDKLPPAARGLLPDKPKGP